MPVRSLASFALAAIPTRRGRADLVRSIEGLRQALVRNGVEPTHVSLSGRAARLLRQEEKLAFKRRQAAKRRAGAT